MFTCWSITNRVFFLIIQQSLKDKAYFTIKIAIVGTEPTTLDKFYSLLLRVNHQKMYKRKTQK